MINIIFILIKIIKVYKLLKVRNRIKLIKTMQIHLKAKPNFINTLPVFQFLN
jgi:hypothetical protein